MKFLAVLWTGCLLFLAACGGGKNNASLPSSFAVGQNVRILWKANDVLAGGKYALYRIEAVEGKWLQLSQEKEGNFVTAGWFSVDFIASIQAVP